MPISTKSMEAWDSGMSHRLPGATLEAPLCAEAAAGCIELVRRFGFAIVESLPCGLDPGSIGLRSNELHTFGAALGVVLKQSPRDEPVESIKDFSDVDPVPDDRGYRSGGEMLPHSDPPTLIILHCVQPAAAGGESQIVSVASIHQAMEKAVPGLAAELFAPLPNWRVDGQDDDGVVGGSPNPKRQPVLARKGDAPGAAISCYLYRPFLERAAAATGYHLSDRQVAALDLFEEMSLSEALTLRFMLQPGQTLVLHNRSVLHARTDFDDHRDLARRRHLLRMWIDAPDTFPVHRSHEMGDLFSPPGVAPQVAYTPANAGQLSAQARARGALAARL